MASVTIEEAQAHLPELVHRLNADQEVVITENDQPVARLVKSAPQSPTMRRLGTMKGSVLYMAPDFDAPLRIFASTWNETRARCALPYLGRRRTREDCRGGEGRARRPGEPIADGRWYHVRVVYL